MKRLLLLVFLCSVVVLNSGCTRAFRNVLGIQSDAKGTPEMETFAPRHAGFEVVMPTPRDEVASMTDMMQSNFLYKHEDGFYSLSWGMIHGLMMSPQSFQDSLNEISAGVVKGVGGNPTVTTPIQYIGGGTAPDAFRGGKEIEGTLDEKRVFKLRVYVIGTTEWKTSYSLIVGGKKEFVNSPEANRFLTSLKLKD